MRVVDAFIVCRHGLANPVKLIDMCGGGVGCIEISWEVFLIRSLFILFVDSLLILFSLCMLLEVIRMFTYISPISPPPPHHRGKAM